MSSPRRLLVVSDDAVARAGLRALAEAAGLAVVAEAATDGVDDAADANADAALWDLGRTGVGDGLRNLAARLPVLVVLWSDEQAQSALAAGARAVLARERIEQQLGPAVEAAVAGLVAVDAAVAEPLARPRVGAAPLVEALTPRETEVLQLLAEGLTNRRIGERLGISEHTAKFHVNAILGKLGAQSRGEAIAQAARLGLLLL